jgi:C-terminal processing protease CtpA/Prc
VDYDYKAAYCGPLSIAGGTLGSAHIMSQTGPDGMDEDVSRGDGGGDTVPGSSGNTIFSSGDPNFEQIYEDIQEVFIDVIAPAGKLGVIIDSPNDGAPVIFAVKEASPIVDKVQIGDKLVAIDDEDVRAMTAMKVSKLLSSKSTSHRKLTLIRTEKVYVPNNDNV